MAITSGGSRIRRAGRLLSLFGGASLVLFGTVKLTGFISHKRELRKRVRDLEEVYAKKLDELTANRIALMNKRQENEELRKAIQQKNQASNPFSLR